MAVRFLPILQYLGRRYAVDLIVIDDVVDPDASTHVPELRSISFMFSRARHVPVPLRKVITALRGMAPLGAPLGQMDYRDRRDLKRELRARLAGSSYSAVLVSGAAWMMVPSLGYPRNCRVVYDFVDSPTLHMRRGGWLKGLERLLRRHTERKCAHLERRVRRFATAAIYVSKPDADAIGPLHSAPAPLVIPNGVLEDPVGSQNPVPPIRPVIGFLGNMGYIPNINAALRLARNVMPRIRATISAAELLVIGRDPAPEILQLRGPSVTVTGTVDDIWPYVREVRAFVFPMLSGAGLQNKILEAMSAGVPVVTTSLSAQSLGATAGSEVLVADDDAEIARLAADLVADDVLWRRLSHAGQAFVREHHSWVGLAPQYAAALLGVAPTESAAK
jgi:glycosyltransferase involved in cell wall biosynthesis